jgi:hypothetical protein
MYSVQLVATATACVPTVACWCLQGKLPLTFPNIENETQFSPHQWPGYGKASDNKTPGFADYSEMHFSMKKQSLTQTDLDTHKAGDTKSVCRLPLL